MILLGLLLVGVALETLGIGLVIPAIAFMTQNDIAGRYPAAATWLHLLGDPTHKSLAIWGMLLLASVFVVKNLFLAFLAWWQARFSFGFQASLSERLFAAYLRQPYTFHLQRNSAQLMRNVMGVVGEITYVLQQGLVLLAELLVILGITVLLLSVEPLGALLVVATSGLAGWGFMRITRKHIVRWGKALQTHEGLRIQHLQQGLGGVKDVKLLGRENEFLDQYRKHNEGAASSSLSQTAVAALPRLWLELLAVAGLIALVLAMLAQGKSQEALLPTVGLFAVAAFRVMPSVNRVLNAVQGIRYYLPGIDTLYGELSTMAAEERPPQRGKPQPFRNVLQLDRATFRYPGADRDALREATLSIRSGMSIGFIGTSGAGKSTLVDVILGLLAPVSGSVRVDGVDIRTNLRGWQDQIGYVPQVIYLTDDSLLRNIAFGVPPERIDAAAVWHALRAAQLEEFVMTLPLGIDTVVGERGVRLSGGQRQRIGVARALYHDPPLLVLDEATSSLDSLTERGVMEAVRALKGEKTLIVVAHRLTTVEHCDYIYRLENGMIAGEGSPQRMLGAQMAAESAGNA